MSHIDVTHRQRDTRAYPSALTFLRECIPACIDLSQGIAQLSVVMEAKSNSAFVNMLDALSQIVYKSAAVNRALGKIDPTSGCSAFVNVLISRLGHHNARVRRLLLAVLTSIYEKHHQPKQLVKLHRLEPLLQTIQEHDHGVLVRQVASELYASFQSHDIL